MNLSELRQEAWDIAREIGTTDATRLWTEAEMNRYINRVYKYIARETKCIRDDITAAICRIALTPYTDYAALQTAALTNSYAAQDLAWLSDINSWLYVSPEPSGTYASRLDSAAHSLCAYSLPLDYRIVDIDEIKYTYLTWRLTHVSSDKWQVNPWWEQVRGMPTEYATDLANNRLNLNFRYTSSDILKLVVRRLPLQDLSADADTPEFRLNYHDFMINGILMHMYGKQDAQTFDGEKRDAYRIEFYRDVDEIKQQESVLNTRLRPNHSVEAFR